MDREGLRDGRARDGAFQLAFGMGKYPNRGVLDAYAGVSRGRRAVDGAVEPQAVARASSDRRSGPSATRCSSRCARCASASTPTTSCRSPSSGPSPAPCRPRSSSTSSTAAATGCDSTRTSSATTTSGPASGWVEIDGERTRARRPDGGVDPRPLVGRPLHGGRAARRRGRRARPSGRADDRHVVADALRAARRQPLRDPRLLPAPRVGGWGRVELQGGIEHPDGRREPFAALVPSSRSATTTGGCSKARARLHDGRRIAAADHRHADGRHRLPPRHRPLLRARRPLARRVAGRPARRRRAHRRLLASRPPTASTSSATAWCGSTTPSAAAPGGATCRASSSAPTRDRPDRGSVVHVTLAIERDLDELRDGLERWLGRPVTASSGPRRAGRARR